MKNDRANLYRHILKCYDGNISSVEQCQSSDFIGTVLHLHCTKEPTGSFMFQYIQLFVYARLENV